MLLQRMPGAADSAMARFIAWLSDSGRFHGTDYEQLWVWSVDHPEQFWAALWDFFGVRSSSRPGTVLADRSMPGATWFPGVRLNYAGPLPPVCSNVRCKSSSRRLTSPLPRPGTIPWPAARISSATGATRCKACATMAAACRRSRSRRDVPYLVILLFCCLLGLLATCALL